MKNILFIASEGVPFIKTGGLADVVGSLPKYFNKDEFDVRVILPKYVCIKEEYKSQMTYLDHFYINLAWRSQYVGVFMMAKKAPSMPPSLPTRCRLPLRLPVCSFRLPPAPGKTPPPFPRWRRPLFIICCCFSSADISGQKQKLNCDKCKKRFCIPRIYVMYKRIIYKFSRELP